MERVVNLGTMTWAGLGRGVVQLSNIPDDFMNDSYRISRILLDARMDISCGAGGGCTSIQILDVLTNILVKAKGHNFCNTSGRLLWFLTDEIDGRNRTKPAAIVANTANAIRHTIHEIPFADHTGYSYNDYVIPAKLFNDGQLEVAWGAAAIDANTTLNAMTVTVWAVVERKNDVSIPAYIQISDATVTMGPDQLPAGIYRDLILAKPAAGFTGAAQVTSIRCNAQGEDIHQTVTPDAIYWDYERKHNQQGANGSLLGWIDNATNCEWLPIIYQAYNRDANKSTGDVDTGGGSLIMQLQGTLTSPQYVYRLIRPMTAGHVRDVMVGQGITDPSQVITKVKTHSKDPISAQSTAKRGRALPRKVLGATSVQALGAKASRFVQVGQSLKK